METVASTSMGTSVVSKSENEETVPTSSEKKRDPGGTFKCTFCSLVERFDFKGARPPFARQIIYLEDCYVMKDPFSLPNRGEVLVLGADCNICNRPVCLGCSVFYSKRFCQKCALDNILHLPAQLHGKIRSLIKDGNV